MSPHHQTHAAALVLVTAVIYLAGFVAPSLESLLVSGSAACGCGDSCLCGCQCCGETDEVVAVVASCCGLTVVSHEDSGTAPAWTRACNCGARANGDHIIYRLFKPALVAVPTRPSPDQPPVIPSHFFTADLPSRPHTPDDPVPIIHS